LDDKRFIQAKQQLDKVVSNAPENLLAQKLLGAVCVSMEKKEEALHHFKLALRLAPEDVALADQIYKIENQEPTPQNSEPKEEKPVEKPSEPAEVEVKKEEEIPLPEQVWVDDEDFGGAEASLPFSDDEQREGMAQVLGLNEQEVEEPFSTEHISKAFKTETGTDKEITTETLADLYFQQGQYDRSLRIFEKLAGPHPEVRQKVEACREKLDATQAEADLKEKKIEVLQGVLNRLSPSETTTD